MSKSKIGTVEAVMLILTIVISSTILSLPKEILSLNRSASILNLLYVSIIAITISVLIYKLFKKFPGSDIIDISEFLGGKVLKNIVGIIFIAYFIITSSILLRSFCESLKIIYFPTTNVLFIILMFIITICIANRLDFNATLKANLIIIPIVLVSIIFIFFTNMNKFIPQKIFPILGTGFFNTFVLGLTNLASFGGIAYLYFLPPFLKEPEKFKKIAFSSSLISAIYIILCVATLLFMFSYLLDTNEITPLYNATRYIEFGTFFQRLDSIFLSIWIFVFACYLSIASKFSMYILKKLTHIHSKKPLIDIFGLLILAIALLPKNYAVSETFETNVYPYLVIAICFFLGLGLLVFANLYKKKKTQMNQP